MKNTPIAKIIPNTDMRCQIKGLSRILDTLNLDKEQTYAFINKRRTLVKIFYGHLNIILTYYSHVPISNAEIPYLPAKLSQFSPVKQKRKAA